MLVKVTYRVLYIYDCHSQVFFLVLQKPSTIKLVDIAFRNIRGTSGNKDAVKLLCSKGHPCENVEIGDINIEYKGPDGPPTFECTNVTPKLVGTQNPKACVGPVVKAPGQA